MGVLFDDERSQSSGVRWWFLQGYFTETGQAPHHFMFCFFEIAAKTPGYSLMATELDDLSADSHSFQSVATASAVDLLLEKLQGENSNVSPQISLPYCLEVEEFGLPSPIQVVADLPVVDEKNNTISWSDFILLEKDDELIFRGELPSSGLVEFTLGSTDEVFHYGDRQSSSAGGFTRLSSCPNLSLQGTVNEKPVIGRAWYDYQCCGYDFLWNLEKDSGLLGWDWFGLNCENGIAIVVFNYHFFGTEKEDKLKVLVMYPDGTTSSPGDASLNVLQYWRSKTFHIRYPSTVQLIVPSLQLDFTIEPYAKDQEIHFPGFMRSIWEGAGKFSGRMSGENVYGRARIEFFGYGYITDIKDYLLDHTKRIDRVIADFLPQQVTSSWVEKYIGAPEFKHDPDTITSFLAEPTWDMVNRRGKHWRPICGHLFLQTLEVDPEPYLELIYSVAELNHTGSLMIDDIEDESLVRRGEACTHLHFGLDVAINCGNALYFLPYLLLKQHPVLDEKQKLLAHELMVEMLSQCHIGQGLDISWSKDVTRARLEKGLQNGFDQKLLQMYAYKTGAQVGGIAQMACIIARTSNEVREVFGKLGRSFGVAFQIMDDINNFSNGKGWKKKRGEDIRNTTPTYVILKALEMMTPSERERFISIYTTRELRMNDEYLDEAVDILTGCGVLTFCHQQAQEMMEKVWHDFTRVSCHNDARIMLKMLMFSILNYSYEA